MKERLINNWITSIMSVLLFFGSFALVMYDKMPWYGLMPMAVVCGWLLYAKDSSFKKAFNKLNIVSK